MSIESRNDCPHRDECVKEQHNIFDRLVKKFVYPGQKEVSFHEISWILVETNDRIEVILENKCRKDCINNF